MLTGVLVRGLAASFLPEAFAGWVPSGAGRAPLLVLGPEIVKKVKAPAGLSLLYPLPRRPASPVYIAFGTWSDKLQETDTKEHSA